jgi:hypothetical protein
MRAAFLVTAVIVCELAGCGGYRGPARSISASAIAGAGWLRIDPIVFVAARDEDDCGPAAVAMLLASRGVDRREVGSAPHGGATAQVLREELRAHQLRAYVLDGTIADLERELTAGRAVIVGTVKQVGGTQVSHFELVVAFHRAQRRVVTLDPAAGLRESPLAGFESEWARARHTTIVALPPPAASAIATGPSGFAR